MLVNSKELGLQLEQIGKDLLEVHGLRAYSSKLHAEVKELEARLLQQDLTEIDELLIALAAGEIGEGEVTLLGYSFLVTEADPGRDSAMDNSDYGLFVLVSDGRAVLIADVGPNYGDWRGSAGFKPRPLPNFRERLVKKLLPQLWNGVGSLSERIEGVAPQCIPALKTQTETHWSV